jgi:hypothetical protein
VAEVVDVVHHEQRLVARALADEGEQCAKPVAVGKL